MLFGDERLTPAIKDAWAHLPSLDHAAEQSRTEPISSSARWVRRYYF